MGLRDFLLLTLLHAFNTVLRSGSMVYFDGPFFSQYSQELTGSATPPKQRSQAPVLCRVALGTLLEVLVTPRDGDTGKGQTATRKYRGINVEVDDLDEASEYIG